MWKAELHVTALPPRTHTKGRNRPPSPLPLSRCLTLTRLLRLGCRAWSSLNRHRASQRQEKGTRSYPPSSPRLKAHAPASSALGLLLPCCRCCLFSWLQAEAAPATPREGSTNTHYCFACVASQSASWAHEKRGAGKRLSAERRSTGHRVLISQREQESCFQPPRSTEQESSPGTHDERHHKPSGGNAGCSSPKTNSRLEKVQGGKKPMEETQSQKPVLQSIKQAFGQQRNYFPF